MFKKSDTNLTSAGQTSWMQIRMLRRKETMRISLLLLFLFAALNSEPNKSLLAAPSYYIDTEEFRWSSFPLKVYVDMNDWSRSDYAVAAREALDNWVKSVWNYTQTYNDTSLPGISYLLYLSNINATQGYDVCLTFAPDYIPPNPRTVGLTTYSWDTVTHSPIGSITINITTFSAKASKLFVKNVIMHEFGHALGVGHAWQPNTLNGPELMYYASSKDQIVYPSTLDVYGLTRVYAGEFSHVNVTLPANIPYVMLAEGAIPPSKTNFWEDYSPYIPILGILALITITVTVLAQITKKKRNDNVLEPPPPPAPDDVTIQM